MGSTNRRKDDLITAATLEHFFHLLIPRLSDGDGGGLTFESVDEILWCYHSNETSSAVLSPWYYIFSM